MSDDSEQKPGGVKRRRIVSWNPDEENGGSSARTPKRKSKKPFVPIGVGLLIALALFIAIRFYMIIQEDAAKNDQETADISPLNNGTAKYRFVSRERVERFKAEAKSAMDVVKKLTDEHETLLQNLLSIENNFDTANQLIDSGDYPQAMELFDSITDEVEDFKKLIALKEQANARYDDFLVLIEENEKIRMFAPFEYEIAVNFGIEGRNAYETGSFFEAFNAFTDGIAAMKTMEDQILTSLSRMELKGKKALTSGDKGSAVEVFEEILRLQPDNELALRNLMRAQTIDQVHPLLSKAKAFEKKGSLEEALVAFEEAFDIDSYSIKAHQGKYRLAKTIKDNKYAQLLASGESAVEDKLWDEAIGHYEAASKVFPDLQEPKDAIVKTREMKRQAMISAALNKAHDYEREYDWYKARDAYQEVLDIESGHEVATEGLVNAGKLVRAILRFENFLELAEEKAVKGEFQEAIYDFNEAMTLKPDYLPLEGSARRLQQILKEQSQPVRIVFTSDGSTWVSVSGYKMLGKFKGEYTENFLPGNYRVVGRRKGYQDILFEVRVRSGNQLPVINVVCNDRI
jgi:tetratricopeptide (TPR) repeat protein